MNCPVCNTEGADIGLVKVYCPNHGCKWYDAEQAVKARANWIVPKEECNPIDAYTGASQFNPINGILGGKTPTVLPPPEDGSIYLSITGDSYMYKDGDWYKL